jgi:hypothetical protein
MFQIISSHEFSQDMLDEKLKENERRRRKAVKNVDLEMSQYLEDERLAIALQNSEFLQELRGNEDFMKTLEKGMGVCLQRKILEKDIGVLLYRMRKYLLLLTDYLNCDSVD